MDDFKSFYELASNAYPAEVIGICTKPQRLQTIRQELSERLDSVVPNLRLYWGLVPLEGAQETYQLFMINDQGEATAVLDEQGIDRVRTTPHTDLGRLVMEGTMNQKAASIWGEMTSQAANDNNRCVAIVWNERLLSAPRVMEPILSGAFMIMSDFTDAEQEEIVEAIKIGRLPFPLKLEIEGGHD